MSEPIRIDKWLWAVRLFKTRTLAADACRRGHVRINQLPVKAARDVHPGEVVSIRIGQMTRTFRVVGLLKNRVGAAEVPLYAEDLTAPEEYARPREPNLRMPAWRPAGSGRPTKRDRRKLDAWNTSAASDSE